MRLLAISFVVSLIMLVGCKEKKVEQTLARAAKDTLVSTHPDTTEIRESVQGFFAWYEQHQDALGHIRFIQDTPHHLKLNEDSLHAYLELLRSSGFISDELLENETRFYRACAKIWKTQKENEIPAGLAMDRFHCALDYIAPYKNGQVSSELHGDSALATLTLHGHNGEQADFHYQMRKENGKWLLSKLMCNSGVEY